jgi:hypothetical protein
MGFPSDYWNATQSTRRFDSFWSGFLAVLHKASPAKLMAKFFHWHVFSLNGRTVRARISQNQAHCPPKGLRDGVLNLSAGRNGQRQHYSEKAGLARDGQRFNKFKCNLRRSSLPLFASNGFPVLSEIGHRLVALLVVICLPAIVAILCGFDRVAVGSVVRHPDHVAA